MNIKFQSYKDPNSDPCHLRKKVEIFLLEQTTQFEDERFNLSFNIDFCMFLVSFIFILFIIFGKIYQFCTSSNDFRRYRLYNSAQFLIFNRRCKMVYYLRVTQRQAINV